MQTRESERVSETERVKRRGCEKRGRGRLASVSTVEFNGRMVGWMYAGGARIRVCVCVVCGVWRDGMGSDRP